MRVSTLICTKNRAASLRATLASLAAVEVPSGWKVETIVVDNGSTDSTLEMVRGTVLPWGGARCVVEPRPGVASARSRAIRESRGEVLLWTDDDVCLPPNWLRDMVALILNGKMDAVAGGVRLAKDRERSWMGTCIRSWLASSEGLCAGRPRRMIGANMAFHRRVLEGASSFDPALGPGALGMGEETLFSFQIERAGFVIGSAFDIVVDHAFDPARLCPEGLAGLARSMGRSEAYIDYHWKGVDAGDAGRKVLDARLRHAYHCTVTRIASSAPWGLAERELQALSRVHYWSFMRTLFGKARKYFRPAREQHGHPKRFEPVEGGGRVNRPGCGGAWSSTQTSIGK